MSLATGGSETLVAHAKSASGADVSGPTFFWSTSDTLVATVTQAGVVTAHQPGAAQVGASAQGKSGIAVVIVVQALVHLVKVTPAPDTIYAVAPNNKITLTGRAYDANGKLLAGRPLFWSSSSGLATVSSTGVVTATGSGAGTAIITATSPDSGLPSGSATVHVLGHIASVDVSPSISYLSTSGSFFLPQMVQLTATITDQFGTDVSSSRSVSWSSASTAVAVVSRNGLVTGVSTANATTTITARTPDGVTGSATVNVFP